LIDKIRHGIGKINNLIVTDKDLGPGFLIGHSFFCPTINETKVDDNWYRTIIETEIAPLLREYWFDKKAAEIDAIISQLCDDTT
jgi:5-methylcytosine-specific restriction enzyme B